MQSLVSSTPQDYIPVAIQALVVLAFVVIVLAVSNILGPKRKAKKKLENFECGIDQVGNARSPYPVKYFLVAILFVLFDVEVVFMYPWAVNFRTLGAFGFWEMMAFTVVVVAGFVYVLLRNVFNWQKEE